jgi:intracellular sulfur oxidation DsrE/DsrF family protein
MIQTTKRSTVRFLLTAALAVPLLGTLGACASGGPGPTARERVVIQVSDGDPAKWNLALNVAGNVQQAFGKDKVDVAIVAYGPGIGMLKAMAPVEARVSGAAAQGVQVLACENTMRREKLVKADMNPGIRYVQAGVIEIMRLQREGWAYVRP